MIRKLNYDNPEKATMNLHQTKEYFNSLETASKHDIWKAKYSLLEWANEVRQQTHKEKIDACDAAAPGAPTPKDLPDNTVQEANIKVLVGQNKPVYKS